MLREERQRAAGLVLQLLVGGGGQDELGLAVAGGLPAVLLVPGLEVIPARVERRVGAAVGGLVDELGDDTERADQAAGVHVLDHLAEWDGAGKGRLRGAVRLSELGAIGEQGQVRRRGGAGGAGEVEAKAEYAEEDDASFHGVPLHLGGGVEKPAPGFHGSDTEITFRFFHVPRLAMLASRIVRGTLAEMSSWAGPGKKLIDTPLAPLPRTWAFFDAAVGLPISAGAVDDDVHACSSRPAAMRIASDGFLSGDVGDLRVVQPPAVRVDVTAEAPLRHQTPSAIEAVDVVGAVRVLLEAEGFPAEAEDLVELQLRA